jgi:hypothetical protein
MGLTIVEVVSCDDLYRAGGRIQVIDRQHDLADGVSERDIE